MSWSEDDQQQMDDFLQAELRACLPILPTLAQLLEDASAVNEKSVTGICGRFHTLTKHAVATEESSGAEDLHKMCESTQKTLLRLLGRIEESCAASMQGAQDAAAIHESMRQIEHVLKEMEGLSSRTRILALNGQIEAVRAGSHGKTFGVVASETARLAGDVRHGSDSISRVVHEVKSKVDRMATQMTQQAQRDRDETAACRKEVDDVLASLLAATQRLQKNLVEELARGQQLRHYSCQAVVDLQFQDMISQRIAHVTKALREIHEALTERLDLGDEAGPARIDWAHRLAASFTMESERQLTGLDAEPLPTDSGGSITLF